MRKAKSLHVGLELGSVNPCKVTIWYEDASAHARAVEVCEEVAQQVDPQLTIDITGWRLEELDQEAPARDAIQAVANADIVLISTRSAALPLKARECLEACARTRTKSDGALAWLMVAPTVSAASAERLSSDLRQAASRLGMDFLPPGFFQDLLQAPGQPDGVGIAELTASRESDAPGYDHWGLNE